MRQYYRIGEIALLTGVSVHTIRKLEIEKKVPAPSRSFSNQRVYTESDLKAIKDFLSNR